MGIYFLGASRLFLILCLSEEWVALPRFVHAVQHQIKVEMAIRTSILVANIVGVDHLSQGGEHSLMIIYILHVLLLLLLLAGFAQPCHRDRLRVKLLAQLLAGGVVRHLGRPDDIRSMGYVTSLGKGTWLHTWVSD
jgi:hypothetical protein